MSRGETDKARDVWQRGANRFPGAAELTARAEEGATQGAETPRSGE